MCLKKNDGVVCCPTKHHVGHEKSPEKIDGAVATVMAFDRAIRCGADNTESVYDQRGILVL